MLPTFNAKSHSGCAEKAISENKNSLRHAVKVVIVPSIKAMREKKNNS
jgi:hypothetical protein